MVGDDGQQSGDAGMAPGGNEGAAGSLEGVPGEEWNEETEAALGPAYEAPEDAGAYHLGLNLSKPELQAEHSAVPVTAVQEIGEAMHAAGLPDYMGRQLYERGIELYLEAGEGGPDEAALERSQQLGMGELVSKHGDAEAAAMIRDARAVVGLAAKSNPNVVEWLEATGLGNDPHTIETLARFARVQRMRGRLK